MLVRHMEHHAYICQCPTAFTCGRSSEGKWSHLGDWAWGHPNASLLNFPTAHIKLSLYVYSQSSPSLLFQRMKCPRLTSLMSSPSAASGLSLSSWFFLLSVNMPSALLCKPFSILLFLKLSIIFSVYFQWPPAFTDGTSSSLFTLSALLADSLQRTRWS